MANTRLTFDLDRCLDDHAFDIADDCQILTGAALSAKHKYDALRATAEELQHALESKQSEVERLQAEGDAGAQQLREAHAKLIARFQDKSVKAYKQTKQIQELKDRNRQLHEKVKHSERQRDKMQHLICEICREDVKSVVTRCGHGFCSSCMEGVFHTEPPLGVRLVCCPLCRSHLFGATDVWPIYMAADETGQRTTDEGREQSVNASWSGSEQDRSEYLAAAAQRGVGRAESVYGGSPAGGL